MADEPTSYEEFLAAVAALAAEQTKKGTRNPTEPNQARRGSE